MRCNLKCLPKEKKVSGIIVREERGHVFINNYKNEQKELDQLENRLKIIKAKIAERIEYKNREEIRKIILGLNRKHNLPGVNSPLEDLSKIIVLKK